MTIIAAGAVMITEALTATPRRAADAGFTVPAEPAASAQSQVAQSSAGAGLGEAARIRHPATILALQEQPSEAADRAPQADDREARRHGQDMLEALTALQRELLTDGGGADALSRLGALAERVPATQDPALAQILSAIRLRARLELLRRQRQSPTAVDGEAQSGAAVTSL